MLIALAYELGNSSDHGAGSAGGGGGGIASIYVASSSTQMLTRLINTSGFMSRDLLRANLAMKTMAATLAHKLECSPVAVGDVLEPLVSQMDAIFAPASRAASRVLL